MMNITAKPRFIALFVVALSVGTALIFTMNTQSALAQEAETACRGIVAAGGDCGSGDDELNNVIRNVINVLLYAVGVASVIALIIGGIRYVVSGGDQQAVAAAKNTIVYAIVGLIVAVLSFVAIDFVFESVA